MALVYSTIVGTARYPQRADEFEKNANEINGLSAKLRRYIEKIELENEKLNALRECSPLATEQIELLIKSIAELEEKIERIGNEHSKVASSIGTHEKVDYDNASLEMSDAKHRGGKKIGVWAWTKFRSFIFFFSLPTILLIGELIFISDMLRVTAIFTPYLTVPAGR